MNTAILVLVLFFWCCVFCLLFLLLIAALARVGTLRFWDSSHRTVDCSTSVITNNSLLQKEKKQFNYSSRHLFESRGRLEKSVVVLLPYNHVPPRLPSTGTSSINLPYYVAVNRNIREEKLPVDAQVWARDLPKTLLLCYEQEFELNGTNSWYCIICIICIIKNKEIQMARDYDF